MTCNNEKMTKRHFKWSSESMIVCAWTGTLLMNPTKCLWRLEPDRRSNYFFFSPPAHLCAVNCMTEISLIVTLNNQFTSPHLTFVYSTSILIFDSLQDRIEYRIENTEQNKIEQKICKIEQNRVIPIFYSSLYSILFCILFYSVFYSILSCILQVLFLYRTIPVFYSIMQFYSILFSILFYSIPFCILFCILFYSILYFANIILFYLASCKYYFYIGQFLFSILSCNSILFCSLFYSILFYSILFHSIFYFVFYSILFYLAFCKHYFLYNMLVSQLDYCLTPYQRLYNMSFYLFHNIHINL